MSCVLIKRTLAPLSPVGEEYILPVFSPQSRGRGNNLSGFAILSGQSCSARVCMVSRSGSEYIYPIACCFSLPTPCSPVIEPPWSTQR